MQDQDKQKFATLIKVLAETYSPNDKPSKERVEIYFRVLSEYTIEQVEQGIIKLLKTRKTTTTFPVPGEIIDAIGGDQSNSLLALKKAEAAVEHHGSYSTVVFDDPVIHMVITAMGGWPRFCCPEAYGDNQEWHWKQKEFISLYETFSKNPRANCPYQLSGLSDIHNSARGFDKFIEKPKIVGDERKAIEWREEIKQKTIIPLIDLAREV
jgi:hypothetical protein